MLLSWSIRHLTFKGLTMFENLEEYFVDLVEEGQEEAIVFECCAEDREHAKEQAENSYPQCTIVSIL